LIVFLIYPRMKFLEQNFESKLRPIESFRGKSKFHSTNFTVDVDQL
jgi:hypothetical protein